MRHRCLALVVVLFAGMARADDKVHRVATRDELAAAMAAAVPGTKILVQPGTYRGGLSHANLRGTAEQPIVIEAAQADRPPIFQGGGSGLHLSSPAHVELRNLVFEEADGNGLNLDDGGSPQSPGHHLVLAGLEIRDIGPRGNQDGIKLSGVNEFRVEGCTVERWGDGGSAIDLVGCHRGTIAGCAFRHKAAGSERANGIQTKGGSIQIAVQRCRFENAGGRAVNIGGSTGGSTSAPGPRVLRPGRLRSRIAPFSAPCPPWPSWAWTPRWCDTTRFTAPRGGSCGSFKRTKIRDSCPAATGGLKTTFSCSARRTCAPS